MNRKVICGGEYDGTTMHYACENCKRPINPWDKVCSFCRCDLDDVEIRSSDIPGWITKQPRSIVDILIDREKIG